MGMIGGMGKPRADEEASSGRLIGEEAKPRVLLSWGGPDRKRVADVLALHAPTIRAIDRLGHIRQDDYDVLVTNRMDTMLADQASDWNLMGLEERLFVLSFVPAQKPGSAGFGQADFCLNHQHCAIRWASGYLSKSIEVPHNLLPVATDLVNDNLVPIAQSRRSHVYFSGNVLSIPAVLSGSNSGPAEERAQLPEDAFVLHPFLRTGGRDPRILAGWYRRSESSEGWVLPADVRRPWDWITAAIRHWAVTYRRFPFLGWWEDPRWQTLAETHATATRTKLKQELADATARLHEKITAATAELESAQQGAAGGPRRLLTDKGDSLKEAAAQAFEQLGYRVTDRDQEQPHDAAGNIEDLGVFDPDEPSLDPVVEVKGYDRGAKAGDVGKMVRHLVRAKDSGRSPSAIWWVVNHWRIRSPAERGPVLAGEDALIADHAGEDVPLVVVDTAQLFRVIRAVEEGTLTPDQVRASLRAAKGRWDIDRLPGESATGDSA
jgi:hypothetical protein